MGSMTVTTTTGHATSASTNGSADQTVNQTVQDLIERSNRLGADKRNTNYAGGNTSAKGLGFDPATGEDVELLWVKGSGGDLGTLKESGLAVLRLDRMRALRSVYPGVEREDEMVSAFDYTLHGKGGARAPRRPSTRPCTGSSTPRTSTTCTPIPASPSPPPSTARH
jgi:rhamnose utilization protein RhaD (predicted bifunctional aldolase and dehydrogenase)